MTHIPFLWDRNGHLRDRSVTEGNNSMEKMIQLQRKIAPELVEQIEGRYNILKHIQHAQPIGRRALSALLKLSERVVRSDVEFLKEAGLIDFSAVGMRITQDGQRMLTELADYVGALHGLAVLEESLEDALGLSRVVVVPGDSEKDPAVFSELGRTAARILTETLADNMIVAVSGGSTMADLAGKVNQSFAGITVVPSRGGLGEQVQYQANLVAAVLAAKLGGTYRLLHIADNLSDEALEAVLASDQSTMAVVNLMKRADILVHGIGRADTMAKRRELPEEVIDHITTECVGETLGHYFNMDGECKYVTNSVGLRLNDLEQIGKVIAVAGGRAKAEAVLSVVRARRQDILILDEAAAQTIQSII